MVNRQVSAIRANAARKMNDATVKERMSRWARRHMPTREQLEGNRWTRSLARRSELWRLTRRSVPRGVAIGLLVGIFALIPGVQMVGAALMCVPCRGNIPIAAATTFLSNPATTPVIIGIALYIGNNFGYHADLASFISLYQRGASVGEWAHWLFSDAAPALVIGLFVFSSAVAAVGYLVSSYLWRQIVGRRRRRRLQGARQKRPAE